MCQTADKPARRVRVLYVDDFADVADTAVLLLNMLGYDARAAYDGPAALSLFPEVEPDVCVLDLNMPGMDGDELAVKLRERAGHRHLVLVAVTARSDDASRRRIEAAGFDHHLTKPADPASLVSSFAADGSSG